MLVLHSEAREPGRERLRAPDSMSGCPSGSLSPPVQTAEGVSCSNDSRLAHRSKPAGGLVANGVAQVAVLGEAVPYGLALDLPNHWPRPMCGGEPGIARERRSFVRSGSLPPLVSRFSFPARPETATLASCARGRQEVRETRRVDRRARGTGIVGRPPAMGSVARSSCLRGAPIHRATLGTVVE